MGETSTLTVHDTAEQQAEYMLVASAVNCAMQGRTDWIGMVTSWFKASEFSDPQYGRLFQSVLDLCEAEAPVSDFSLASAFSHRFKDDGMPFRERVENTYRIVCDGSGQGGHIAYYARLVHDAYRRREGSEDIHRAADELGSADSPDHVLDSLPAIRTRYAPAPERQVEDNREVFQEIIDEAHGNHRVPLIRFGLDDVDNLVPGLGPGLLCTVMGRTSSGKSVLLLQTAIRCASTLGKTVLFYSFEMTMKELVMRGAAQLSRCPMTHARNPDFVEGLSRMREMTDASNGKLRITVGSRTVERIQSEAQAYASVNELGLIVVDYVQITRPSKGKDASREQQVAHIIEGMKSMAMQTGVPVLTATQLNEQGQTRESRAIEHSSNVLLEVVPRNDDAVNVDVDIFIRKNRDGARGRGVVYWERPLFIMRDRDTVDWETGGVL